MTGDQFYFKITMSGQVNFFFRVLNSFFPSHYLPGELLPLLPSLLIDQWQPLVLDSLPSFHFCRFSVHHVSFHALPFPLYPVLFLNIWP
jgi:hypothetical protein